MTVTGLLCGFKILYFISCDKKAGNFPRFFAFGKDKKMSDYKYHDKQEISARKKLNELKKELPSFMQDYFRGIDSSATLKTQVAYAYDARIFFHYIQTHNPTLKNMEVKDFPLQILEQLTVQDLEEYVEFLTYQDDELTIQRNHEQGLYRRVSSLRSIYKYFHRNKMIENNPSEQIATPKVREKSIIHLEPDEIAELLDLVEAGTGYSEHQTAYRQKLKVRDLAILTLLLGTGIRVSECVGLDLNHVDLQNDAIRIMRKGNKEAIIYFGDEVEDALRKYMEERKQIVPLEGHENALFLSTRRQRLSVRSMEVLVSSYAKLAVPLKKISPHKLRSSYGTTLYQETGDIRLVADVLGHSDVNTTKKHYAAQSEHAKRMAGKVVKLRES